jgi:hypothetical protein
MINHEAIYGLYPNVRSVDANGIARDAEGNEVSYNLGELDSWVDPNLWIKQRQAEYPSYADQFDTIFHEGIDAWKAQIQAVKDKYPKV